MARTRLENGVEIPLTPEEETARDAEEKAWADKAPERELEAFYDKRRSEYPSIEELVVALYDTDDKAAI